MRTKNCYELIHSYKALEEFIGILPDEQDGEQFYITLFARKKYDLSGLLRSDKNCIKRVTARKRDIIQKIEQMEVGVGSYTYDGVTIPEECLAVYITPNPRSFHAASTHLVKGLVSKICDGRVTKNPYSEALNYLQTSCENKVYFDIDVDFLRPEQLGRFKEAIANFINLDCLTFIRTRGGYHVLVKLAQISPTCKHWHQGFAKLKFDDVGIMMNSDSLVPIVGCRQADFTPVLEKV
jgi:hypothetical protein